MKVVIAPDSFKESLSALEVCQHIKAGFSTIFPDAHYEFLPLADGGEGTVEVLLQALNGQKMLSLVEGPLGEQVQAEWALLEGGKTALIEVAAASGLDKVPPHLRNPLVTSTFGTGQLIKEALDRGVNKILLGLGGSATNDAGAGIVEALGGVFYNSHGEKICRGGQALAEVAHLDLSQVDKRCAQIQFVIACDVTNHLTGVTGASHVFGPQKGAGPDDVVRLDAALDHFAHLVQKLTGEDNRNSPGYGAAGGTPLGLSLIFKTKIKPGIEMILETLDADKVLQGANLVITGEGQMDNQTLQGKTPFGIAQKAADLGIPVIGIAGSLGAESEDLMHYFDGIFSTVRAPQSLDQVLSEAGTNLQRTAKNVAAMLKLGIAMHQK